MRETGSDGIPIGIVGEVTTRTLNERTAIVGFFGVGYSFLNKGGGAIERFHRKVLCCFSVQIVGDAMDGSLASFQCPLGDVEIFYSPSIECDGL